MAPVDGPKAVETFLEHWQPDAAVFAEGEIWPNMLGGLRDASRCRGPGERAHDDKTLKRLEQPAGRRARDLLAFGFIRRRRSGDRRRPWSAPSGRPIETVGNLKTATAVEGPSIRKGRRIPRQRTNGRPIVLAASTHPAKTSSRSTPSSKSACASPAC